PAGANCVRDLDPADKPRVYLVPAVKVDPVPVDEPLPIPRGRDPQRIMIENHPGAPARDTARTRIEADGNSLVSKVRAVFADLIGGHQARTIIHVTPGFDRGRLRPAAGPAR